MIDQNRLAETSESKTTDQKVRSSNLLGRATVFQSSPRVFNAFPCVLALIQRGLWGSKLIHVYKLSIKTVEQ